MPSKEKPYRVYRAGRGRGPIEPLRPPTPSDRPGPAGGNGGGAPPAAPPEPTPGIPPREPPPRPRRGRRWVRWTLAAILVGVLLVAAWGVAGWFSLRSGVQQANARLPEAASRALTPQEGSLLGSPGTVLLLGVDEGAGREGRGRADAIVLARTDPEDHRISLLSIPRDLRVEIPGYGPDKINAAYAYGGAALAVRTVESVTGIDVNHVMVVDFGTFDQLVDALGGITVNVPRTIVSNRFDCPYASAARCERWPGWRFAEGDQELDGRRALIFARIRENTLAPDENDLTRGGRQQQVVEAIVDELAGVGGFMRLPFVGKDVMAPIATDLSTTELMQLGWVKFRSSSTLRCRLGGVPEESGGIAYLTGIEENADVVRMVTGETAPRKPSTIAGPFAPGCQVQS